MLAPIWNLILMQMMFLPYHSFPITWWHRAVVVADAGMTLFLWYRLVYLHEIAVPPLLFRDRSRRLITSAFREVSVWLHSPSGCLSGKGARQASRGLGGRT